MPLPEAYQDNISTVLPKADYGIKIAKANYDALTAADRDLLFNSSWPSVQIVKVKSVTAGEAVPHGLLFPPVAFMLGGTTYETIMYGQDVDDTNVYPRSTGKMVIYNIDISTDVEYPYTDTVSVNTTYDPDYGVKMVKEGGDIDSTELRDYILHSRCGSPLVLAVKTQETVNDANTDIVQYTSRMGYPTLNFGYSGRPPGATTSSGRTYGNNGYQFAPQGGQSIPIAFTDGFTTYTPIYTSFSDGRASIICLRSPMFATTNTVQVNY